MHTRSHASGVRPVLQLIILFLVNILLITLFYQAQAVPLKRGASGSAVREVQSKLKRWGYYSGAVDGIYGSGTVDAVKYFQRKNGLTPDGIAGPATLRAMGISTVSASASVSRDADLYLLARIISAEARGEPYEGQVAVGAVVLNRVRHPSFPNTLAGVIYQNGAFTAIVDGQFDEPIADSAWRAARDAMAGWDPSGGAIYYYNPARTTSVWIYSREVIKTIGQHVFAV